MEDSDDEVMKQNDAYRQEKLGTTAEEDYDDKEAKTKIEKIKQTEKEEYLKEEHGIFKEGTYVWIEATLEKRFTVLLSNEKLVTLCSLEN